MSRGMGAVERALLQHMLRRGITEDAFEAADFGVRHWGWLGWGDLPYSMAMTLCQYVEDGE